MVYVHSMFHYILRYMASSFTVKDKFLTINKKKGEKNTLRDNIIKDVILLLKLFN